MWTSSDALAVELGGIWREPAGQDTELNGLYPADLLGSAVADIVVPVIATACVAAVLATVDAYHSVLLPYVVVRLYSQATVDRLLVRWI